MHVVVVGAGVVGLSIAATLAERGNAVTVLEQKAPGAGTTATSYAWVNSNNKQPDSYYRLNLAGMAAHRELARAAHGEWLVAHGHVEFATYDEHARELAARAERLTGLGYQAEVLNADQARTLVPGLRLPSDVQLAVNFAAEAHCFPLPFLAFQLGRLRRQGGVVRRAEVAEVRESAVQLGDGTVVEADRVVLAAGRWTGPLLAGSGISLTMAEYAHPGDLTVGYLCTTTPTAAALDRLVTSPRLNVRPDGGGRLRLQALDLDVTADPFDPPAADSELGKEFLARLQGLLEDTDEAQVERIVVGRRAIPADGLTIAGPVPDAPGLYVVATHSGITLAPYLGESVANELSGQQDPLLRDFRPDRLLNALDVASPTPPRRPGEQ